MTSRLFNVRLDEDRWRKARKLRERGVTLAELVRESIDRRFEQVSQRGQARDVTAILKRIFERYPDPPDLPPRAYDVHDRREARAAIRRTLRNRGQ